MTVPAARSRATRVLVVDDSVVARQLVARAVSRGAGLELAGVAASGRSALESLPSTRPDVVVLDLEMPGMDGFETLAAIRSIHPALPVVIFSHHTPQGAAATFRAMALGATAYALKPTSATGADGAIRDDLLPLLRAVGRVAVPSTCGPARVRSEPAGSRAARVSIVVVGVSTGGPNALTQVLGALPADLAVPLMVVQHMPPVFTARLADRLDTAGPLRVAEAVDGAPLVAGTVLLAPGGRHLAIGSRDGRRVAVVHDGPSENSCRPAVDVLFRSAAEMYGADVLAVVLTGMGQDGLLGSRAVCAAGGTVLAQDPTTAVVGSMPRSVVDAGLAYAVVPLEEIAAEVARRSTPGRAG